MTSESVARWGETEARRFLERSGWVIVAVNWHCRYGEIDLIGRDRRAWVFVEVKTRRGHSFGLPEDAITPSKRHRLLRSAWTYLEENSLQGADWRIDVIAIEGRPGRDPVRLDHYRDALEADQDAYR
jgi:putative endonuclease